MNKKPIQYTEQVDKHIYVAEGCETAEQWVDLAIAALDQAGFAGRFQAEVRNLIENRFNSIAQ